MDMPEAAAISGGDIPMYWLQALRGSAVPFLSPVVNDRADIGDWI